MTVSSEFCRHYPPGGMMDNIHCSVGIEMQSVSDKSVRPYRCPCHDPEVAHLCAKYEPYTPEEIAEADAWFEAFMAKMNALWERTSEECPMCGQHVEEMVQVRRSVYARPCGCRQGQGRVPDVWKPAEK